MMMWAVVSSIMAHIISLIICYSAIVIFVILLIHGGQRNWKEEEKCMMKQLEDEHSKREHSHTGQINETSQPYLFDQLNDSEKSHTRSSLELRADSEQDSL